MGFGGFCKIGHDFEFWENSDYADQNWISFRSPLAVVGIFESPQVGNVVLLGTIEWS